VGRALLHCKVGAILAAAAEHKDKEMTIATRNREETRL